VVVPAVIVVLLLLFVVMAIPALLSGDGVRQMLVQQVSDATGATVELGEASVRVLPHLAVHLGQGHIAGTGAALTEHQGSDFDLVAYEAAIEVVEVRVALWPLLSRRIKVLGVEVVLEHLSVTLPQDRLLVEQAVLTVRDLRLGVPGQNEPAATGGPRPPGELIPGDLYCRGDLSVSRLTVHGTRYVDLRAEMELDGPLLTVDPVRIGLAGGEITGTFVIDWMRDPWGELDFSFATTGVPAAALLAPWAPDLGNKLETVLVGEGSGQCSLRDQATTMATLDVTGQAGAGEGVLHAADWLREVRPYLGQRQDLVEVRFRELVHAFRVENGRYLVQDLFIDGIDTQWRGEGWVGLDGTIDLRLGARLPAGFTPDLGRWSFMADALRDQQGRVNLDLHLTGLSRQPAVAVDLTQLKEAARDNAGEVLREGLSGLLDKWRDR